MITYKDKIVCFIDILGFREMVNVEYLDHPDKMYSILSRINIAITDWSDTAITSNIDLQITQFSDSIVFSFLPASHYFMTFSFFKQLSVDMVMEGVIFRGGITYGKIFHNEEFVFGPAMIRAYDLESKVAVFPRIIIDNSALELKDDNRKTIEDYTGQFVFKIDDAGSSIDYIYDVYSYATKLEEYYTQLRVIIVKGLGCGVENVVKKYEWMKQEYNRAKEKFGELQLIE